MYIQFSKKSNIWHYQWITFNQEHACVLKMPTFIKLNRSREAARFFYFNKLACNKSEIY